jgi:hypothetical protein
MNALSKGIEMTNKKTARIAGLLYLLMAIFSAFSMMYVDPKLYVAGNAAATVSTILANEWLFRLGFVSNLIGQIIFLFLVHALYQLLKSVDKEQAMLMVILVVASVPVTFLNMLNQFAPILLLSGAGYLAAFNPSQLQALAMVFLDLQKLGVYIAEFFWGLWLFPFGLLVFRSGFFPKVLGVMLMLGCFGYLVECFVIFLHPDYKVITYPGLVISAVAEFSCIFWLLFKGVKDQQPAVINAV